MHIHQVFVQSTANLVTAEADKERSGILVFAFLSVRWWSYCNFLARFFPACIRSTGLRLHERQIPLPPSDNPLTVNSKVGKAQIAPDLNNTHAAGQQCD